MRRWCVILLALAGCRQLLDLHDLEVDAAPGAADGHPTDATSTDAQPADAAADAAPDVDLDGVPDSRDNCPTVANADQADEDHDAVGDACDNCPGIANADQADQGEIAAGKAADGVGDACDPNPSAGGDHIVLFLGFNSMADLAAWTVAGTGATATVSGGQLVLACSGDVGILWDNTVDVANGAVTTHVDYDTANPATGNGAALMMRFTRGAPPDFGTGLGCGEFTQGNGGGALFPSGYSFANGGYATSPFETSVGSASSGHSATYIATTKKNDNHVACTILGQAYSGDTGNEAGSGVNFVVAGGTARFDFLQVID